MSDKAEQKEFRLKGGDKILRYAREFRPTEKVIFGLFLTLALITAAVMAVKSSNAFMTDVRAYGGELREGVVGLPRTINPLLAVTETDKDLVSLVYSGLMKYQNGSLVPDLASSYTISSDGLTYDFKIRPDLRFQDGEDLTADDIEFTIQKIQDPNLKSPRKAEWTNVAVKKISAREIQFTLKQAYSPFLSNTTVGILPKHLWEKVSDEQFIFSKNNVEPVGSGPYKIASINRDSGGIPTEYNLETWKKHYGKKPFVSSIKLSLFADLDKALGALDAGTIDSVSSVPPAIATRLASDSAQAYTVMKTPLPRVFGVFFNQNQSSVLADKNVRQALAMSVDRDSVVNKVLQGYGVSIDGPLPGDVSRASGADLANARTLLEKGGWKMGADGFYAKKNGKNATTTLAFDLYTGDTVDLKQTAELLKITWGKLGVKIGIKVFEAGDLYQNVIRTRKYDVLLFGEQIGKDRDLYAFWHSSQRNYPGLNISMYANGKVDKILDGIRTTNDNEKKTADYAALEQLIKNDAPAVFLYSPDFIYAVPKNLKGVVLNGVATPSDRWNSIADWYLNTEKVWNFLVKKEK